MTESFRWPLDDEVQALDLERGTITTLAGRRPTEEPSAKPDTIEEGDRRPVAEEHPLVAGRPLFVGRPSKGAILFAAWRAIGRRWALPVLAVVVAVESVLLAWAFLKADAPSGAAVTSGSSRIPNNAEQAATPSEPTTSDPTQNFAAAVTANRAALDTTGATTAPPPARPSPPAPTPIAPTGSVAITLPFQVEVYERGQLLGVSGGKSLALSAGAHQLELVNESLEYRAALPVTVFSDQTTRPAVALPTGTLSLNASPWAEVLIDGKAIGETPLANVRVPIGPHRIVFRHPQFPEQTRSVVVTAQTSMRIGVDLEK